MAPTPYRPAAEVVGVEVSPSPSISTFLPAAGSLFLGMAEAGAEGLEGGP